MRSFGRTEMKHQKKILIRYIIYFHRYEEAYVSVEWFLCPDICLNS